MVKFGPSGNSQIFYDAGNKASVQAPKWLAENGLNAYEVSFGRGVKMSVKTAKEMGAQAKQYGIEISVHAPYYINFANPDDEMKMRSFHHITTSLELLKAMGGQHLVVHIASQGKLTRQEALELTKTRLHELFEKVDFKNTYKDIYICLETMGRVPQIGTPQEIIDLCALHPNLMPAFDFGHVNCLMQGKLNSAKDYINIFKYCEKVLGTPRTKNCHIHFSKIEFNEKGEVRHLDFDDEIYGPDFLPLAQAITQLGLTPTIICESKTKMAEDAMLMRDIFESVNALPNCAKTKNFAI